MWLARQDEGQSQARVIPDVRSVAVGNDLGFSLGLRGKNGDEVKDGDYEVEVETPGGERKKVTPTRDGSEDRGVLPAGERRVNTRSMFMADGKDADGQDVMRRGVGAVPGVRGRRRDGGVGGGRGFSARSWPTKAAASSGAARSWRRSWNSCRRRRRRRRSRRVDTDPDWNSASWSPFFVLFFVLFTGLLAGEWFLRRRWGMV